MDEYQLLEDNINKVDSSVSSMTVPYSSSSDEHAIIYICSPNESKQKQFESILHDLNPSTSILYYSTTTNDNERKLSCSEENNVMAIGSIRFPTTLEAEKVYALLNGISLQPTSTTSSLSSNIIQLRYNPFSRHHHGDTTTLLIDNLPTTLSISNIYDILRKYGPIVKCRCELTSTTSVIKNRIEVEYLQNEDANNAQAQLSQMVFDDQHLSITVIAGILFRSNPSEHSDRSSDSYSDEIGTSPPTKGKRKHKNRQSQYLIHKDDTHLLQVEIKPSMDLCNLYIKGLSLSMTSNELFNLFKPHGRIISARVMANDQGVSKGFGFVSFSQPIEAASALVHLQHHYSILFHEPKVPRSDHDIQQQYLSLACSPLAGYFYSTTVSLPSPSDTVTATAPAGQSAPPPPSTAMPYYIYSVPPPPFTYPPPTTPYYYHPPPLPPLYYAPPYSYSTIPPMPIQRCEIQQAVQQALTNDKQQQETVDMLMALDESEKQKCLNDMTYLTEKMDQLHR